MHAPHPSFVAFCPHTCTRTRNHAIFACRLLVEFATHNDTYAHMLICPHCLSSSRTGRGLLSTESKHTDTLAHALICTFLHHLPSSHACRLVKYGKQAHWHIGTRAHLHVCTPFIIIACLQACWVRKAQRSRRVLDCEELLVGKVWQRWLHQRRTWHRLR
jgi:hypothetical protein